MRSIFAIIMLAACGTATAQQRIPPAEDCLDARTVAEVHQADPHTLAVVGRDGRRFRLDLAIACPGADSPDAVMLAREGWVCAHDKAFIRTAQATCPVAAVTPIEAREHAQLARIASLSADGVQTLDTVQVRAERRRGFAGSPSFCFSPRWLRAWSEDPQGMTVEVSPRQSGGHRRYRVELASGCPSLDSSPTIQFRSGMGIGLICGNPGDRIEVIQESRGNTYGEHRESDVRGEMMRSRIQCSVSAVYPYEPEAE